MNKTLHASHSSVAWSLQSDVRALISTIAYAYRNIARHRRRTLTALSIIAGGIASLIIAAGFIQWIFFSMRESTIHAQLGHIQIVRPGFHEKGISDPYHYLLPSSAAAVEGRLSDIGVELITPRLVFNGLISRGEASISFTGEGVVPENEARINTAVRIVSGRPLSDATPDGILIGEGLAANLGVKPGDAVVLLSTTSTGAMNGADGRIVGLFATATKAYDDSTLRVPIEMARKLVRVDSSTSWVMLLKQTSRTDEVIREFRSVLPAREFELVPWHQMADFYNKTVALFSRQVAVVKFLIGLIIVLSISNTLTMTVVERTNEIGTAMALGIRRNKILKQFLTEGALLGLLGGIAGTALGSAIAAVVSAIGIPMPPPPGSAHGYTGEILVSPSLIFEAILLALIATLAASLIPAWRASRLNIVDALRHRA